jgi:hypothetical protein
MYTARQKVVAYLALVQNVKVGFINYSHVLTGGRHFLERSFFVVASCYYLILKVINHQSAIRLNSLFVLAHKTSFLII